jgi:hypothetical protein
LLFTGLSLGRLIQFNSLSVDNTITLSDGDEDQDENISQLDYDGDELDDDDDIQLLVVRPKSKSLQLPFLPEGQPESETALTSRSGYVKVRIFIRSYLSH